MRIQQLSLLLTNQIAAGEVIERPASVVKELVENSLDAGSNSIHIDLMNSGIDFIQIRDNGCGIHHDDLKLAVSTHATSKLHHLEDLKNMKTLGFRGEALASMSAISHFSLSSRTAQQEMGYRISCSGQEQTTQIEPQAQPIGTTVQVKKIFFNTPARRKFLRAPSTELYHIEAMVKQFILSHYELHLSLKNNDKAKLIMAAAHTEQQRLERVKRIFSKKFIENAVMVDRSTTGMRLWGWVGLADFQRSQTDLQYFYLNRRTIRDRIIFHAIRQSYADQLYPGKQPTYLLYLEIEPSTVDVNVHPTKNEVRFHEERMVHDFIVSTLHHTLNKQTVTYGQASSTASMAHQNKNTFNDNRTRPSNQWHQVGIGIKEYSAQAIKHDPEHSLTQGADDYPLGIALALLNNRLIIAKTKISLVICDYQCAMTQLRYLQLCEQFSGEGIKARTLHVPFILPLDQKMIATLKDHASTIKLLAVELDVIDQGSLVVRKIPACLRDVDIKMLILHLAQYFTELKNDSLTQAAYETIFLLMAKYTVQAVDCQLSALNQLLRQLEKHQCPQKTNDGQTIIKFLAMSQLIAIING